MRDRVTENEAEDDQSSHAESEDDGGIDWAVECLMLTHEPIRCDLAAIESAAKRIARDEKPEEWRVRCFFRFFDDFCSLISQFFAVEISVHCDWLCAEGEAGEQLTSGHIVAADYRIELMRQHRELEELMLDLASLEGALMGLDEDTDVMGHKPVVSATAARTVSKMASIRQGGQQTMRGPAASFRPTQPALVEGLAAGSQARAPQHAHGMHTPRAPCTFHARTIPVLYQEGMMQLLGEALDNLAAQLRQHLGTQEYTMPEVMLARFGDSAAGAPERLVHHIIEAARGAMPPGALEREQLPPLLTWVYHYLKERDAPRARRFAQHLPKSSRKRIGRLDSFLALDESHANRLRPLRAIEEGTHAPAKQGRLSAPLKRRPRTESEVAKRNAKSRSHLSSARRTQLDRESGGGTGSAPSQQKPPPGPTRRNSTEVRTTHRKGALLNARLIAANANRDLTALPNDAMREQINLQAQQKDRQMDR